jgi:carbonic anhydrase
VSLDSAEALALLKAGNARFVTGSAQNAPSREFGDQPTGQQPFAIVLGCSDSRVPIETIFDQVPGRIFVVRVAGNFLNDVNYGSIEFAVAVLKAKLIVVLGHGNCGAVAAAVACAKTGVTQPGHIAALVEAIAPAVESTRGLPGDWLANAIIENVRRNVAAMTAGSEIIAQYAGRGEVAVLGALYDLGSGAVAFA